MHRVRLLLVVLSLILVAGCVSTPPSEAPPPADPPDREVPGAEAPAEDADLSDSGDDAAPSAGDTPGSASAAPWVPPETVPASSRPSAVERRRLAAYANTVALLPADVHRVSIGSGAYQEQLVATLLTGATNRTDGGARSKALDRQAAGYRLDTTVVGETQPSGQNFYGRVRIDRSVVDGVTGEEIARSARSGPWTFSRVSVEDAQLNSLRRLLEDGDSVDTVRRRFAGAMMRGVAYRLYLTGAFPAAERESIASLLRSVAFSVERLDDGLLIRSLAPPDQLEVRVRSLFAGSPYEFAIDSMTRDIVIGYTQD